MQPAPDVTQLLIQWNSGDASALEAMMPLVYRELQRIAHRYLQRESASHTLQTTALVNEAYLKLIDQTRVNWQNRSQFYAVAAQAMRPDLFVAVAAYGDYAPGYIGTEVAYSQGGYETGPTASHVAPGVEQVLTGVIRRLLSD